MVARKRGPEKMYTDCESQQNYIFNHDFCLPGPSGNFPMGWQKYKSGKTSSIDWNNDNNIASIRIKNRTRLMTSICQQRLFSIPVYEAQVWKVGVICRSNEKLNATIIVHFVSTSSRLLQTTLDFNIEPENEHYYSTVTINSGVDYAYIEIGLKEPGTIWIEDVEFSRVFPVDKFDADARGRLNINSVENIKRILEPVLMQGKIETVKQSKDIFEDVIAEPMYGNSSVQDVLNLDTYSYCVINLGDHNALVYVQISPDAVHWINEPNANNRIKPGQSKVLVCNNFLRYIRVVYQAENGGNTRLRIFFQGQG